MKSEREILEIELYMSNVNWLTLKLYEENILNIVQNTK